MPASDRPPRRDPPAPSADDRALWERVTRDIQPLAPRRRAGRGAAPATGGAEEAAGPKPARPAPRPAPPGSPGPRGPEPELRHGEAAGLDRRSAARLKRGRLPVEAALDLHGHTQSAARDALARFLDAAQARDLRCVLVITGKGVTKDAGGVLRAQVPRWLNEPENRARVLAFAYAQPKHGGLGALYVLLRRRRAERRD